MKKALKTVTPRIRQQEERAEKEDYAADSILESMQKLRINCALEETLRYSEPYQALRKRLHEKSQRIRMTGLTKEQWQAVDHTLSAYNETSAMYGELAYAQGFRDAVALQKELSKL